MNIITYHVPPHSLPNLSTTYARWSAAETPNGGLDADGNWLSAYGDKTLLRYRDAFSYNPTGFNGTGCIETPQKHGDYTRYGSFYLPGVTLPNDSAASLMVLRSNVTDVQVVLEYSDNVNANPQTFGHFIESNVTEGYVNIGGSARLWNATQLLNEPTIVAQRVYLNPATTDYYDTGRPVQLRGDSGVASKTATDFGIRTLHVGSRNNAEYFIVGQIAAVHIFHTAPSNYEWSAWIDHYKKTYNIS